MTKNSHSFERLCSAVAYQFNNPQLLETALTHRSCGQPNNERLEFLGDSILNFAIAHELFQRFETAPEGKLSALRAQLVKGDTLAEIAVELGLGEYLKLGQGERMSGGFRRPSILADAVEAIVGAIYLDSGLESAQHTISVLFKDRLEKIVLNASSKDAKTRLQEWLQARKKSLPVYTLLATSDDASIQFTRVQCLIEFADLCVVAEGSNRKDAEKHAAAETLQKLESKFGRK